MSSVRTRIKGLRSPLMMDWACKKNLKKKKKNFNAGAANNTLRMLAVESVMLVREFP